MWSTVADYKSRTREVTFVFLTATRDNLQQAARKPRPYRDTFFQVTVTINNAPFGRHGQIYGNLILPRERYILRLAHVPSSLKPPYSSCKQPVLQGADGTFAETAGGISAAVASVGAWAAEVAELVKGKISWEGSVAKIIDSASIGRDARLQQTSEENIAGMGKDLLSSLEVPVVGKDGAAERYEDAPTVVPVVGNGGSAFSVDLTTVDGTAVECTQGLETVGDDLSAPGNAGASSNSEEVIPRVLAGETFDEPRAEGDVAGEQSACNVIVTAPDVKVEGDVAHLSAGLTGSDSAALSAPDLNIGMTGVESDTEVRVGYSRSFRSPKF